MLWHYRCCVFFCPHCTANSACFNTLNI
jgi:hypothetical protein